MTRVSIPQISIFTFSLLVLLFSFFFHFYLDQEKQTSIKIEPPQETHVKNHIIRFIQYKKAQDHREYLERNVKLKGWEWVERKNPAMKFDTDFALVAIQEFMLELLIGEFAKLELVKDVSLDLSYQRGVLEENNGKVGAFVDGNKRPGKIFTAMSFDEEENYDAVASASSSRITWRRNLMMRKSLFLTAGKHTSGNRMFLLERYNLKLILIG